MHSSSKTVTKADKSSQNSDWGRVRDTSLDGKCLSVEEFQSCLWHYIPSFHVQMGGDCTSHLYHNYGEIDTIFDITISSSIFLISSNGTFKSSVFTEI